MTFDTLKFVERRKAAGVPEAHARAEAEALTEAFAQALEALEASIATKADMLRLETKLDKLDLRLSGELVLLKWMFGLLLAGVASLVLKAFFSA